jgi:purine-nucleoside phosphorylase
MTGGPELGALAARAADEIRSRVGDLRPVLGLVLGSGLGGLGERFEEAVEIPYDELPGWPQVGVVGHSGVLVAGRLSGVPAVGLKGRAHLYEGHDPARATLPVRALARLGVGTLFVSNAAGAVNRAFAPGDLMLISDHLNLMGSNPLMGPQVEGDIRFPDMTEAYDRELGEVVRRVAEEQGTPLPEGVYAALLGPSYETPAEIRMLERLGADAVGMSTVPEVIMARAMGMRCFGVSCLTNYAAGISPEPLSHDEVIETTERVAKRFQELVLRAVGGMAHLLKPGPSG